MNLKAKIDPAKLPRHVAVIMDGNGRWAKNKGQTRVYGHQHGVQAVHSTVEACAEIGIEYLTLYTFSTENWDRPESEINALMELLVEAISNELKELNENDIRLHTIGDLSKLPEKCRKEIARAKKVTARNQRMHLVVALNYSARWEITNAVRQIGKDILTEKVKIQDINQSLVNRYLTTKDMPEPELLIRTSGEYRISNFLLWQLAYAELYFTHTLWPDFSKQEFYKALLNFQQRERRFGKISEQINKV